MEPTKFVPEPQYIGPIEPPGDEDLEARYHSHSHPQARYSSHSLFFPPSALISNMVPSLSSRDISVPTMSSGKGSNTTPMSLPVGQYNSPDQRKALLGWCLVLLLLCTLGFHILSHISQNLNAPAQLWKIGRHLIRSPCANSLLTIPNFHITSIWCQVDKINRDGLNEIQKKIQHSQTSRAGPGGGEADDKQRL